MTTHACRVFTDELPTAQELASLFAQAGWARHRTLDEIEAMRAATTVFAAVRDGGRLVAFGRALCDGAFRALVDDVIVDEGCRGRGIGSMVMEALMQRLCGIDEVFLNTGPELERFYGRYGFSTFGGLTMVAESPG